MKKKQGRPKKEGTKALYVRLPDSLAAAIRNKAEEDHRDISATIALMINAQLSLDRP
jgi:hypothetical protein